MTIRSRLAETKTHKLMTIASLAIQDDVFNYANACIQFESMQIRRKIWFQARLQQDSWVLFNFLQMVCLYFICLTI